MAIWVGQDGTLNDDDGDGAAAPLAAQAAQVASVQAQQAKQQAVQAAQVASAQQAAQPPPQPVVIDQPPMQQMQQGGQDDFQQELPQPPDPQQFQPPQQQRGGHRRRRHRPRRFRHRHWKGKQNTPGMPLPYIQAQAAAASGAFDVVTDEFGYPLGDEFEDNFLVAGDDDDGGDDDVSYDGSGDDVGDAYDDASYDGGGGIEVDEWIDETIIEPPVVYQQQTVSPVVVRRPGAVIEEIFRPTPHPKRGLWERFTERFFPPRRTMVAPPIQPYDPHFHERRRVAEIERLRLLRHGAPSYACPPGQVPDRFGRCVSANRVPTVIEQQGLAERIALTRRHEALMRDPHLREQERFERERRFHREGDERRPHREGDERRPHPRGGEAGRQPQPHAQRQPLPQQPPQPSQPSQGPQHQSSGFATGWMYPFTDYEGDLLQGAGQYYIYEIERPWFPADEAATYYPEEQLEEYEAYEEKVARTQQALDQPSSGQVRSNYFVGQDVIVEDVVVDQPVYYDWQCPDGYVLDDWGNCVPMTPVVTTTFVIEREILYLYPDIIVEFPDLRLHPEKLFQFHPELRARYAGVRSVSELRNRYQQFHHTAPPARPKDAPPITPAKDAGRGGGGGAARSNAGAGRGAGGAGGGGGGRGGGGHGGGHHARQGAQTPTAQSASAQSQAAATPPPSASAAQAAPRTPPASPPSQTPTQYAQAPQPPPAAQPQAPHGPRPPHAAGWDMPLTDGYGRLLEGPGQYGVFRVEDPYDHRAWNDVDLDMIDAEDNRMYQFVGQDGDDFGSQFGSALSSVFGGDSSGKGGGGLLSSFGGSGDGTDAGSIFGTIANVAAKTVVPALAKAGSQALAQSLAPKPSGQAAPSGGGGSGGSAPPPSSAPPQSARPSGANSSSRSKKAGPQDQLMGQLNRLANKYGVSHPGGSHQGQAPVSREQQIANRAQHAQSSPATSATSSSGPSDGKASLDQLQSFMSSVTAPQGSGAS